MKQSTSIRGQLQENINPNIKNVSIHLHDFKMNISKTLNSQTLKNFHFSEVDTKQLKRQKKKTTRLSSTPTIPVKVIPHWPR